MSSLPSACGSVPARGGLRGRRGFAWLGSISLQLLSWATLLAVGAAQARSQSALSSAASPSVVTEPAGLDFFESRIRPVLVDHCYSCHSATAEKVKGGFLLDTRAGLLSGGDSGQPAVVPGDPEKGTLLRAVRHGDPDLKMPPKTRLPERVIEDLAAWIRMGAPDPRTGLGRTNSVAGSSKMHWAFTPVRDVPPPGVKDPDRWVRNPIDQFTLARLEREGIVPAPLADGRTLIRRMSLDLLGVPPGPEEVAQFVVELEREGDRAVGRLVERLLASPQYGERWGRHWLDVARYSDSKGYVYAREERFFVHAHGYRDWVVRALNSDMPYDRFLMLQIAADRLVPADSADLAAMGFVTGGRRFLGVTHDIIDDRIDVVTRGTMALTVQCARCHDHKYDPIPTRDYYSLYGVFHNSADVVLRLEPPMEGNEAEAAFEAGYRKRMGAFQEQLALRRGEAETRLRLRAGEYLEAQLDLTKTPEEGFDQLLTGDDVIPASVRRWRDYLHRIRDTAHPVLGPWLVWTRAGADADPAARVRVARALPGLNRRVAALLDPAPGSASELARRYGELFRAVDSEWRFAERVALGAGLPRPVGLEDRASEEIRRWLFDAGSPTTLPELGMINIEQFFPTPVTEKLWKILGEVDRWVNSQARPPTHALVLKDQEPEPNPRVFRRGNPAQKGEEVPRRFVSVVAGTNAAPFTDGSGRLELAQAIVAPGNPLTPRVMVNRLWQHHFGAGLVKTPSDFGLRAEPPSHPELLDWLATRFVDGGWSLKAMHRLILMSATYRQAGAPVSGAVAARAAELDPENRWLWRFGRRRLDFEQMRDSLLAVSGELQPSVGGKPQDMFAPASRRRSIYGTVDRQFLPAVFRAFDFANPDLHIPGRHETTVSQQALFFLNNRFPADRARALMREPGVRSAAAGAERVRQLYQRIYQRDPTPAEVERATRFIAAAEQEGAKPAAATVGESAGTGAAAGVGGALGPWEQYAHVLLMANEFSFLD